MSRQRTNPALPLGALAAGFGLSLMGSTVVAQTVPDSNTVKKTDTALPEVTVKDAIARAPAKENYQAVTTTIGKGKQEMRDIPQSITVLTEKLLDDVKLDTLKQALHYTAGITFAATENGTDQDIRLRGFPIATTGDLLIDGMRDPSQYDRDTFNYDRIEVMRGSASMIFGRGSTGGVVNQVTKKPMLANQSDVVGTVGTDGYFRTTTDFNIRTDEDAALRINAMVTKADNKGAKIDKYGIAPTYSWGIGSSDEFSVGLFYLDVDNVPQAGIGWLSGRVANITPGNFYGSKSDYLLGKATYLTFSNAHRFAGGGELRTQLRSGVFDRAQWGSAAAFTNRNNPNFNSPAATASNLSDATNLQRNGLNPRKDSYNGTYVQSDYSNSFKWWGIKHDVLAGVDLAYETADRYNSGNVGSNFNKGTTTVGNPNDGTSLSVLPAYRPTNNYEATALGAYVQDLMQVAPHWKLLGGVRIDDLSGKNGTVNYNTAGVVTSTPAADLSYHSLWSYRAGALYQPSPTQSYHLSYSTSFTTSADTYQYTSAALNNVPAEKSRNIELGAKLDWLEGLLSTRAALFRTEKYNERTTDSDFAGQFYTLSGQRHSEGIELDVVGRITSQWEVYLSYSHMFSAKIDKAGNATSALGSATSAAAVGQDVGLTPKNTGSAWLSYQATPQLRLAGGIRGASGNYPLQGGSGAAQKANKAAGYVAGDMMLEYKFTPDLYAQVNITNITNQLYGDQLYPGFVISGEARSAKFTVGMRF